MSGYSVVKIPPLPPEVSALITLNVGSHDHASVFEDMRRSLAELRELFSSYSHRAEHPSIIVSESTARITELLNNWTDFGTRARAPTAAALKPEVEFIKKKFDRVVRKISQKWREASGKCSAETGMFICALEEFLAKEVPVRVDVAKFKEHLKQKCRTDLDLLMFKRDALRAKLESITPWSKYRKVNEGILRRDLGRAVEQVSDGALFAPESCFDDSLFNWFNGSQERMGTLLETVMGMRGFKKKMFKGRGMYTSMYAFRPSRANFDTFHEKVGALVALCSDPGDEDDPKKEVVVRSAFTRLIFDALFDMDKVIERGNGPLDRKARAITRMTPKQLGVADGFFLPEDGDRTFAEIAAGDEELRQMSDMIASVTFLTCPIDIAVVVQDVVDMVGARVNRQKKTKEVMQLDDLMSCLIPVVALNPPPNSVGINDFLEMYSNERILPARLSLASSVLSAAISYVKQGVAGLEAPSNL